MADDEGNKYPIAKHMLTKRFYVDDLMSGSHSVQEANMRKDQMIELLKEGRFCLRKGVWNSNQLLATIDNDLVESVKAHPLEEDNTVKALGLNWHPSKDIFQFSVSLFCPKYQRCMILWVW